MCFRGHVVHTITVHTSSVQRDILSLMLQQLHCEKPGTYHLGNKKELL